MAVRQPAPIVKPWYTRRSCRRKSLVSFGVSCVRSAHALLSSLRRRASLPTGATAAAASSFLLLMRWRRIENGGEFVSIAQKHFFRTSCCRT